MKWTDSVWERTLPVYNKIISQPFILELAAGTLNEDKFARYLAQDELYIGSYCPLMHELADLLPTDEDKAFMHAFAASGGESEKAMHQLLIDRFGIHTEVAPSSVTSRYCEMLHSSVGSGNAGLAMAAMLPCSWVYNRVGLHILGIAKMDGNPYSEWIAAYGNEEFTQTIGQMLEISDRIAAAASEEERKKMSDAYTEATIYEHAFWDFGYHGENGDYSYVDEWIERWNSTV